MEIGSSFNLGMEQAVSAKQTSQMSTLTDLNSLDYENMTEEDVLGVAQQFESLFINELFKSMRDTVPENTWLDGGMQQDVFEDMLYEEYALSASQSGGIGLSDIVYEYLTQSYQANTVTTDSDIATEVISESEGIYQEA